MMQSFLHTLRDTYILWTIYPGKCTYLSCHIVHVIYFFPLLLLEFQHLRYEWEYLSKSGSFLGTISRCLKVPRSSVRTIICKYKHCGNVRLKKETCPMLWCKMCVSKPEHKSNTLWRCWQKLVRECQSVMYKYVLKGNSTINQKAT